MKGLNQSMMIHTARDIPKLNIVSVHVLIKLLVVFQVVDLNMTFAVDWALKTNYVGYLVVCLIKTGLVVQYESKHTGG